MPWMYIVIMNAQNAKNLILEEKRTAKWKVKIYK
jgi:hypothetical protein